MAESIDDSMAELLDRIEERNRKAFYESARRQQAQWAYTIRSGTKVSLGKVDHPATRRTTQSPPEWAD